MRAHAKKNPEYSVYIYHRPENSNDNFGAWERKNTTMKRYKALRKAEKLYASNEYEKVEVRKKSFDARSKRKTDKILKVYEENFSDPVKVLAVLAFSIVCAAVFVGFLYMLTMAF